MLYQGVQLERFVAEGVLGGDLQVPRHTYNPTTCERHPQLYPKAVDGARVEFYLETQSPMPAEREGGGGGVGGLMALRY